jgi:uncharacterized protein
MTDMLRKASAWKSAMLIILLTMTLFLLGCVNVDSASPKERTISVDGTVELNVQPDQAEINMGVFKLDPVAAKAQADASAVTAQVISALRKEGIPAEDIQTDQLYLYEDRSYDYGINYNPSKNGAVVNTSGSIWRATQTLKVRTTDLSKVGDLIDASIAGGANQINSITFSLTKDNELKFKKQALIKASSASKEKALAIAQGLELSLGRIKSVVESGTSYYPYYTNYQQSMSLGGSGPAANSQDILPHEVSVTGHVTVVYEIN